METWNVMIYLAGDNNLSEEMVWSLEELGKAKIVNSIVSAQLDPRVTRIQPRRYLFTPNMKPRSWEVNTDGKSKDVKAFRNAIKKKGIPVPTNLDLANTGNPLALLYFVWLALRECRKQKKKPSRHMLVLAGHGSGFEGDFLTDDSSRDSLTMPELSRALTNATKLIGKKKKIDILGMDSCLMSTAEVYYEVHNAVDYLIAAEGFETNTGWLYHDFLAHKLGDPRQVAWKVVKSHISSYREYACKSGQSVDLSACRVDYADDTEPPQLILTEPVKRMARALESAVYHPRFADAIILAHWRAQTYKSDQYVDLRNFADLTIKEIRKINARDARRCRVPSEYEEAKKIHLCKAIEKAIENSDQIRSDVIGASSAVIKLIDESLIVNSGYVGPEFQHSHGLSVYLPWDEVSKSYRKSNFAKETEWGEFLDAYAQMTRCAIRIPKSGWTQSIEAAVRFGITEPVKSGRASQPWKRASQPWKRASQPWKRTGEPGSRASQPWKRGQLAFISMKNPPREWLPCDILMGRSPQPKPQQAAKGAGS